MLFSTASKALLGAFAAMAGFASAQKSTEERLMEAQAAYPKCALGCMAELIPASSCNATDVPCLCTNEELNLQITGCALEACTIFEGLTAKNVSMTLCQAPVRDKSMTPLAIGMVFGALALIASGLRGYAMFKKGFRLMGGDDYTIILANFLALPPTIFAIFLVNNGLGKDMWTLELQQIKNVLQLYYLGSIFYFASITTTKMSILLFILRVFPERKFRNIVYGVCGLCMAYGISFIVATALQCWPVEWAWEQVDESMGPGTCNDIHKQGWFSAIFNIILDLIMLALPLQNLWNLQMKMKKKVMIMFMFSLGVFVTIVSVVRLHSLVKFANSQNITWDYTEPAWFSTLEIHVGIICACLPAVRQLLITMGAGALKTGKSASSYGYSSKSGKPKSGLSAGKGDSVVAQEPPTRGDERDFVPLVEYPQKGFEKGTYNVNVSHVNSSGDSV